MYKCSETLLNQFTGYLQKDKPSWLLPVLGLGAGAWAGLTHAKEVEKNKVFKSVAQNILLGGLAGTGLEAVRYGAANGLKHAKGQDLIPGLKAYIAPHPIDVDVSPDGGGGDFCARVSRGGKKMWDAVLGWLD